MAKKSFRTGEVVWRELICPDVGRARAFYGELFGWSFEERRSTTEPAPGNKVSIAYTMIKNADASIGGMLTLPEPGPPPHWMSYVSVEDVDAVTARATAQGGTVIHGPVDLPGTGRFSILKDPTRAAITAFHSTTGDAPAPYPPPVHHFCWETLNSSDPKKAVPFYKNVFGWKEMEAPEPDATVLGVGSEMVCDVQATTGGAPSRFVTHVLVARLAASRERVKALGGRVLDPEIPVPSFGRIALVSDPFGVELGLFEPSQSG